MSLWYEPKKEDIRFSNDGKKMHIWIDSDDNGNIYVSLDVEIIKEILSNHKHE